LIRFIYGLPDSTIQSFAESFKLRKDVNGLKIALDAVLSSGACAVLLFRGYLAGDCAC
jgi:hypothetical protein